jgi:hypothetical protein
MSELEDTMQEHAAEIVFTEHRPFCYSDFVPLFSVNGKSYRLAHGTFKNKSTEFVKKGRWELEYRSRLAFYTLEGHKFGNTKMTCGHTGVKGSRGLPPSNAAHSTDGCQICLLTDTHCIIFGSMSM